MKTYAFEIVRKPVTKVGDLLITNIRDDGQVVYTGSISGATEASAKVVRNHLAMRSDAKHNGDMITDDRTFLYTVYWRNSPKRGKHAKLFRAMNRYSWR